MNKLFCTECGIKHEWTTAKPKFCASCGSSFVPGQKAPVTAAVVVAPVARPVYVDPNRQRHLRSSLSPQEADLPPTDEVVEPFSDSFEEMAATIARDIVVQNDDEGIDADERARRAQGLPALSVRTAAPKQRRR